MESVTEYASQKLSLVSMTLRSWRDLSTLYDGPRPRIWSINNIEYNVKVNIWTWYNIVQDKDAPGEEGNESQEECNEENKIEEPVSLCPVVDSRTNN